MSRFKMIYTDSNYQGSGGSAGSPGRERDRHRLEQLVTKARDWDCDVKTEKPRG